jgi:hypothetical protein
MSKNVLDGWKKMLLTLGGGTPLALDALPAHLVWPYAVVLAAALLAFAVQDFAKAWKGGK